MEPAEVLAALAAFPARLAGAADAAAGRPVPAGAWTPDLIVRHLIAVEVDVHQARLRDLATSVEEPRWSWTEPAPWTGEPSLGLAALLDRFATLRTGTLAAVDALDEVGWARTGIHERLGRWDVAGLLANAASHDDEHLAGLV
jgi:hypothetical protein